MNPADALHRRWAIMLLVATLAMRLLVPAGFMLEDTAGWPRLILCSGRSVPSAPAMHHASGHHAGMGHGKSDAPAPMDHPCAFSAAAFAVDLAAPVTATPLPPLPVVALPMIAFALRPGLGLAAPPPPKTGPPFTA